MARNKKIISMVPAQPGWSISFNADGPDASAEDIVVWALVEDDTGRQYIEGLTYGLPIDLAAYDDCLYHPPEPDGCGPEQKSKEKREAPADKEITGRHYCLIEASEWVKTSRGGYLELVLKVVKGERAGLRFIDRLQLQDIDCIKQEQDFKRLSDYSQLTGQIQINDPSQLHDTPFWVELKEIDGLTGMRLDGREARWPCAGFFSPVEVLE